MNIFFIVGLPRSRTAWLANLLTNGDAFCFHEAARTVGTLEELAAKFKAGEGEYAFIGDAGPAIAEFMPSALSFFPEAKWVFIKRDVDEAYESYQRAFPKLAEPGGKFSALNDTLAAAYRTLSQEPDRAIEVAYEDLEQEGECDRIHNFCLGRMMNADRWKLLTGLRVTAIAEKARASLAPWARRELTVKSQRRSAVDKDWEHLLRDICGSATGQWHKDAFEWLNDLMAIALTWDHVVDGDSINVLVAERAFEAMLLKWPLNAFWKQYSVMLAPVLSNAVAGWRSGSRPRHFDCYSEPALAVAYIIGGADHVRRFSERVHELVTKGMKENDARDGRVNIEHRNTEPCRCNPFGFLFKDCPIHGELAKSEEIERRAC